MFVKKFKNLEIHLLTYYKNNSGDLLLSDHWVPADYKKTSQTTIKNLETAEKCLFEYEILNHVFPICEHLSLFNR